MVNNNQCSDHVKISLIVCDVKSLRYRPETQKRPWQYSQYPLSATCRVQIGATFAGNRTHYLQQTRQPPSLGNIVCTLI